MMLKNCEQENIFQELERMLVAELFAHMLENATDSSDEVEGSKVQSLNSPRNNKYESNSSDDVLIHLLVLYMGIGAQKYLGDRTKIPRSSNIFQSIIAKLSDEQFKQKIRMSIPRKGQLCYGTSVTKKGRGDLLQTPLLRIKVYLLNGYTSNRLIRTIIHLQVARLSILLFQNTTQS